MVTKALLKLADYTASGIGSVAGPMLAAWRADKEAQARRISARGEADSLMIIAEGQANSMQTIAAAQASTQEVLAASNLSMQGELSIAETVAQRIEFQESKRQQNIVSVVQQAAAELGDKDVPDDETDHDWAARFFGEVQDVSSEIMQSLWAKILAGQVERKGSTSLLTVSILRNLDQSTAELFERICSMSISLESDIDSRVPSLGGNAATNALAKYGLDFGYLNALNEHGLIISEYNSWKDYKICIGMPMPSDPSRTMRLPFKYAGQYWILEPVGGRDMRAEFRLSGVAFTRSGRELLRVVQIQHVEEYTRDLQEYFGTQGLKMTPVPTGEGHSL
ncbi:MAG: DUF2806 domain-containing protein [Chloroflexi bacterium]|nr:DUF2806 domain-containing protein [Chloroflexota bacterium]